MDFAVSKWVVLAQKTTARSRHIWSVVRTPSGETFIHLTLVGKQSGEWGMKTMTEEEGPYALDCPVEFFKIAGEPATETARAWRAKVQAG